MRRRREVISGPCVDRCFCLPGYFSLVAACLAAIFVASGCRWDPSGLTPPFQPDGAPRDGASSDASALDGGLPDGSERCGNGILDQGEACDGELLGGATCLSQGFTGGALACTSLCIFDYRGCEGAPECGNHLREPGEACDGTDLGGATCLGFTGLPHGTLTCTSSCALDGSGCHYCGNGSIGGPEECDGDLGGATCVSLGYTAGVLACGQDCRFDVGGCTTCGDGICSASAGERWDQCPQDCGWLRLTGGATHSCGLKKDGSAWCWGANDRGQLGDGTTQPSILPKRVLLGMPVLDISAGEGFTCAVLSNASLNCWGKNDKGQLGDGTIVDRLAPTLVPGLVDLRQVAAGGSHACAMTNAGALYCWGMNDKGQLGDASTVDKLSPVSVSTATGMTVVLSLTAGQKHTCAVDAQKAAWCWGDKGTGRLGDGLNLDQNRPSAVSNTTGLVLVRQISAGNTHTCAVSESGQAFCWGSKAAGRLGDDANADQPVPSPVSTSTGLVLSSAITAGGGHSCAIRDDGAVFCWGENADGAVGDNSTTDRTVPAAVVTTTGLVPAAGLYAGGKHVLGWNAQGDAWGWGEGGAGQLGDGFTLDRLIPTPVSTN
ncbi:MAG: hypothetical protein RBU30_22885 [Polyangia bacterium]|nr:hypothetical protein [Polyangia bacterium]